MILKEKKVTKNARYYMTGEPGPQFRQVWFVLHGYGQLAREFINEFNVLQSPLRMIVAPEALHRFYINCGNDKIGASWMTREDRENDIHDYITYLEDVYAEVMLHCSPAVDVILLGFSQGAATACRWALMGNSPVQRLIMWGGDLPQDIDWETCINRFKHIDLHMIFGENDSYTSPDQIQQQVDLLKLHDVSYTLKMFSGSHELNSDLLLKLGEIDWHPNLRNT